MARPLIVLNQSPVKRGDAMFAISDPTISNRRKVLMLTLLLFAALC